jgi:hypothetical protein
MAHMGDGNIGKIGKGGKKMKFGDQRIGMYKKDQKDSDTGVPMWLGQLQFDPEAGRFKQQGADAEGAGFRLKQIPLPLRKVLKDFPLNIRARLTELDEAGLVRVAELPQEAIRQLRDMKNAIALGVLDRLHEKLVKERGRGGQAENALNGIFRLDSRRKEQAMRRQKAKSKGGQKGGQKRGKGKKVGSMDGNTFARAYCLAGKSY